MSTNHHLTDAQTMKEQELALAVRDALTRYTPLHIWDDQVQVTVRGDTVTLSGLVRTGTAKEIAGNLAREVQGVAQVDNQLVVDAETEIAVAQALAADTRLAQSFPGILVGVVFGVVYLKGTVPTLQDKTRANQIALAVPGVRRVSNELNTLPEPKGVTKPATTAAPNAPARPTA